MAENDRVVVVRFVTRAQSDPEARATVADLLDCESVKADALTSWDILPNGEPASIRLRRWDLTATGITVTLTRPPVPADQRNLTRAVGEFIRALAGEAMGPAPERAELAEIVRRIEAFRILTEESGHTDTGAAWELLDEIEDALKPMVGRDA